MSFEEFQMKRALKALDLIEAFGIRWGEGSAERHLRKRIDNRDLPQDSDLNDYDKKILSILNKDEGELFLHSKDDSFVVGDGEWIVIFSSFDGQIITCFPPAVYERYLSERKGYTYIGSIEEVRNAKIS